MKEYTFDKTGGPASPPAGAAGGAAGAAGTKVRRSYFTVGGLHSC
jgi:hypothetical protein